jgi:sterol desaturase/sphingolipid hydroxylase (fatty acid hydroxylase superfamily)
MHALLTDQARLVMLVVLCGFLWALESIIPLYRFRYSRMRHALPNVALTLMLVITNLSLSFFSAYLAGFTVRNGIGLFAFLGQLCPKSQQTCLGRVSTGSGSDLVNHESQDSLGNIASSSPDQVATAPCSDPVQVRFVLLRQSVLGLKSWAQLIVGVLVLDLFAYFAHVLLHKSWLGWQFHRVHHSENAVDVTTAFRQHPGETVWRILWQLAAIVLLGIPLWVVVVYLILSGLNAELEHANIRLNSRVDHLLRLLVVTPNMHKVHHSRDQRETDSNYSNIFSIWD